MPDAVVVELTDVELATVELVAGALVVVLLDDPVLFPLPIVVVIGPLSMYTPDMYQFSGVAVFTIRSTPT